MRPFYLFITGAFTFIIAAPCVQAASIFEDVPDTYWAQGYIHATAEANIMSGYNETTFGPDNTLTRAETVKIVLRTLGINPREVTAATFSDVPTTHSLWKYVEEAVARKVVQGYTDHEFKPDNPVTRGEFTKILMESAQEIDNPFSLSFPFSDVSDKHTFAAHIYSARDRHYIRGFEDGTFRPDTTITRAQAAKIITLFKNHGVIPDFAILQNSPEEIQILEMINASRAALGKEPFVLNARISMIARSQSTSLSLQYRQLDKVKWQEDNPDATPPWISHRTPDGIDFEKRFRDAADPYGISYKTASENIVWGTFRSRTVSEALAAMHAEMMDLPTPETPDAANQKSNVLSLFAPYREIGIGIVIDHEKQEITMTQEFVEP